MDKRVNKCKIPATKTIEATKKAKEAMSPKIAPKGKKDNPGQTSLLLLGVKNKKHSTPVGSPKGSRGSSRKSSPNTSRQGSPTSGDSDPDTPDGKPRRRRSSPKQVVSLNLNSKNNPLHRDKVLEGILPGGKPDLSKISKQKDDGIKTRESTPEEEHPERKSPTMDEEFRQKVKKMDYNTVFMLAQRTKGPQQYKYRKILQEMYDEQNKS
ncbi:hypothetical protein LOTGIDRAFT_157987 [Lottia gigantea]|uniref:Uncharacterized protein n=1 Tax=Lottia gigantea TaxID=225164 RepID=V4B2M8_LOTGI|nr:hypothetical protein LOTGIDRAFT_157987 [Lottia gigantea]ESP00697.1 hypothetical protein LOTGIDRAFT_157987 [Lottia gigantea]